MDTKFSVAVHVLMLISESPKPMNSNQMAGSVGTNPSYIRKIIGLLKKSNLVNCYKGYRLKVSPNDISLLSIYQAVNGDNKVHIFDIHQNSSDKCIVGKHIKPILSEMFEKMENEFSLLLKAKTLKDCMNAIKGKIKSVKLKLI